VTARKQLAWSVGGATTIMVGALALMFGNWFPWRMAVHNVLWPGVLLGYVLGLGAHSEAMGWVWILGSWATYALLLLVLFRVTSGRTE